MNVWNNLLQNIGDFSSFSKLAYNTVSRLRGSFDSCLYLTRRKTVFGVLFSIPFSFTLISFHFACVVIMDSLYKRYRRQTDRPERHV